MADDDDIAALEYWYMLHKRETMIKRKKWVQHDKLYNVWKLAGNGFSAIYLMNIGIDYSKTVKRFKSQLKDYFYYSDWSRLYFCCCKVYIEYWL